MRACIYAVAVLLRSSEKLAGHGRSEISACFRGMRRVRFIGGREWVGLEHIQDPV